MIRIKDELSQKERAKFQIFSNHDINTIGYPTREDIDLDHTILVAYKKSQVPYLSHLR
jgi:hypothetical protein